LKDNSKNYKGILQDPLETKYYECGAHFKYDDLCQRLEAIKLVRKNPEKESQPIIKSKKFEAQKDLNTIDLIENQKKKSLKETISTLNEEKIDIIKKSVERFSVEAIRRLNKSQVKLTKTPAKNEMQTQTVEKKNQFLTINNYKSNTSNMNDKLSLPNLSKFSVRNNKSNSNLFSRNMTNTQVFRSFGGTIDKGINKNGSTLLNSIQNKTMNSKFYPHGSSNNKFLQNMFLKAKTNPLK